MMKKKRTFEQGLYAGIFVGIVVTIAVCLLGAVIGAWLISSERLDMNGIKWLSIITWILSSFIGTFIAMTMVKKKLAIIALINCVAVILVFIVIATLFCGGISIDIIKGAGSIIAGGLGACLLKLKAGNKKMIKKRRFV